MHRALIIQQNYTAQENQIPFLHNQTFKMSRSTNHKDSINSEIALGNNQQI